MVNRIDGSNGVAMVAPVAIKAEQAEKVTKQTFTKVKPAKVKASKTATKTAAEGWDRFAVCWRNMLAMAMPLFALVLAKVAGTLAQGGKTELACFAGTIGVSCLLVSLADCKQSIQAITGVLTWQAWAVAITVDLAIVVGELVLTFAPELGLDVWVGALMVAVGVFSMGFNAFAFHLNTAARK